MVELIVFALMGLGALAGAVAVVVARNPVYGALGLLGTLFSLGVIYVMNLAHLVAAVQVIVYAGAVMTLFLFVIMMIGIDVEQSTVEKLPFQRQMTLGLAGVIVVAGLLVAIGGRFRWFPTAADDVAIPNGTVEAIAGPMFTEWILPFQATALLLTIAAAGAIALASQRQAADVEDES